MSSITLFHFGDSGDQITLPLDNHKCRTFDDFAESREIIATSTFGTVFKVIDPTDKKTKVLKKLHHNTSMSRKANGLDHTCLREMSVLQNLRHENIIKLEEVVRGKDKYEMYLLLPYCDFTLQSVLYSEGNYVSRAVRKYFFRALLSAVAYMHCHSIMHRDLKPSNLLISHDGTLKIADFGLARRYSVTQSKMTPRMVTLAYRAPELLVGEGYSNPVDLWSCGCILGEMFDRKPLFSPQGDSELSVIKEIFKLLGPPVRSNCPYFSKFDNLAARDGPPKGNFSLKFDDITVASRRLLLSLLSYDPASRIQPGDPTNHEYFTEEPLPALDQNWRPEISQ